MGSGGGGESCGESFCVRPFFASPPRQPRRMRVINCLATIILPFPAINPTPSRVGGTVLWVCGVSYKVVQVNGQRIIGPPEMLKTLEPQERLEVFISNIPPQVTECEIMPMLSVFGCVFQLRLMMKITGGNRGFCYVMYTHEAHARSAIKKLNAVVFHGHTLRASVSRNLRQLILGGMNPSLPDVAILQELQQHIQPKHVHFFMKPCGKCVILEFACHRDAALAKRNFGYQARRLGSNVFFKWHNK
ncbi:RNA-binding protein 47-like [Phlebotomus argentipes]|uniref:RNA-binding protein 47-like n=1 Tax=Phlebotomus argentipes TaxID=94469 RepID=UPI002892DE8E|nr:RNA-binding protein 47-like [Phlebotomus argentipes]